ncbi:MULTISPECIES: pyridoxamine 5'-phosphate oxidase family protein [Micrococcaceae]|jgi:nitroimidazol reductase NimA-like FMN-containing flavoprotein (pyridoxamine 5'-phosphate oxidase superfamily)|uniref:pyridoxamine 5'-phosphate oxidase family protein n=1 Tax=Micrococcaceae TaxID=1268 RepID=UPI00160E4D7A|nr:MULTISPECIES: pyridoxamine 5'-phosphate oxidase family protein [Micrococcaceae]MBB5747845.1 nitroimidazol reductase NimA-like FMN-containing flavoprotein (pyridoxamine 5'-phosphate oxidase superfamily) [Micrococcus sp. TA1]HRO31688.1 pyridoxamine 5'-phosphate oxidase family protein [Citricoccus sp.]HRO94571.1 pyridoxamine 5'-phosphate oxidase family protein [Citricoccus sp.]
MMFEHADDEPILVLDEDQCWRVLENTRHGRLGLRVNDELDLVPVNFVARDKRIYFRTAPGNKLAELTINPKVIFEADGILSDEAWSVLARGHARVLEKDEEIEFAESLSIDPWVPTYKDFYVEVNVNRVTGRHFVFGEHPERFE